MYDIYIDRHLLPIPPEKISIKHNNQNSTINLINDTEFNILKSEGLKEINISFTLPAYEYPFTSFRFGFEGPKHFFEKLRSLKSKKSIFQFIVVRRYSSGSNYFNTNIKVTLEDLTISDDVEQGFDIVVDVTLKEYRATGMSVIDMLQDQLGGYVTLPRPITKIIDRFYTTKAGDTIWQIVRAQTGGIEQLTEIMKKNGLSKINDALPEVLRIGS